MSLLPTAPESIGGVLDRGIRFYKESFTSCIGLIALATVMIAAMMIALFGSALVNAKQDPAAMLALLKSPVTWLAYFVVAVVYMGVYNAVIVRINSIARGESASVSAVLGTGFRLVPRVFVAGIIFGLALGLATILLIIPGIYLYGIFQFFLFAIVVDNAGAFDSLGTSKRLVKGYWWRAATIGFVAIILVIVLSLLGGLVSGLLAAVVKDPLVLFVVSQCVSLVINILTMTLHPSIMLSTYYDLKLRHEGGDLFAKVDAL